MFLVSFVTFGYSTIHTITNVGFAFSPPTLIITVGDSVQFTVTAIHQPVEVSQATWNANGATPLPGGFALPFGGGLVPASLLTVGTHWYVCSVHVLSNGMKGTITVVPATGIKINLQDESKISFYPNPVTSIMKLSMHIPGSEIAQLSIVNIAGQEIMNQPVKNGENIIDMEKLQDGIYYVMVIADNKQIFNSKITVVK